jgi:hypothetical protein
MSWLTPVLREIMGDQAATEHKLMFFENGATPNMVVSMSPDIQPSKFREWEEIFRESTEGVANAYRTLFLGGGADVNVVGSHFQQIDFKETQGAGETRIAAAAGVPPVIAGFSEGLQAATYSNYGQARRRFADGTMRPLWRNAAGSLSRLLTVPTAAELWYDDRDVPFLQDDQVDAAQVQATKASTINTLITAGFKPDAVVQAVMADDLKRLDREHTNMFSVQLQKPGAQDAPGANSGASGAGSPSGSGSGSDEDAGPSTSTSNGGRSATRDLEVEFAPLLGS